MEGRVNSHVDRFQRSGEKYLEQFAEARGKELEAVNKRLKADRAEMRTKIEKIFDDVQLNKPEPIFEKTQGEIDKQLQNTLSILGRWQKKAGIKK
jgi:hypothetical protein